MQWHGAFPAEAEKKCVALVFLVGWKRGKVYDQKICERKRGQRDDDEYEQTVIFPGLQKKANGRNHVGNLCSKSQLAKAAIE